MTTQLDFSALNLQDALDLAVLIEKESEARYLEFADMLGASYPGDASEFFLTMARNERTHGEELAKRRAALFGDAPSRMNEDMVQDVEAPDYHQPRSNMSPRHALEVAMASELKAYDFFAQALVGIQDPEVQRLFEELRDEELAHKQLLEAQKSRYPDTLEQDVAPQDVDTPAL